METPQPTPRRSLRERNPPERYTDFVLSILFNDDEKILVFKKPLIVLIMLHRIWKWKKKWILWRKTRHGNWLNSGKIEKLFDVNGSSNWRKELMVERYNAKLVAKWYSRMESIDYHEIFSPVVKLVSIRIVLALVALLDLEL